MDPFNLPPEVKEQRLRAIRSRLAAATPRRRRQRLIRRTGLLLALTVAGALWWLLRYR